MRGVLLLTDANVYINYEIYWHRMQLSGARGSTVQQGRCLNMNGDVAGCFVDSSALAASANRVDLAGENPAEAGGTGPGAATRRSLVLRDLARFEPETFRTRSSLLTFNDLRSKAWALLRCAVDPHAFSGGLDAGHCA